MASTRLRVAVVGLGVGKAHVEAYLRLPHLYDLVALCDLDEGLARAVAEQAHLDGPARVMTSLDDLCRRDDLDVIDLCTPPHLHLRHTLEVLAAGKHVICEKPLVGSLADVDVLEAAALAAHREVMPIFQYRFGHGLQKLKLLMERGLAGQAYLSTVETMWRRGPDYYAIPWRGRLDTELGGALLTHAIHAHDMLTYILGPVKSVFARTATRVNPIEVEDCSAVSLEMHDGSLATLAVTLGSTVEVTRHRFCFAGLTAESNTRPYTSSGDPWSFTAATGEGEAAVRAALEGFEPLPEGYEGQFYRFHQALQAGTPPPVTLADARTGLELITALYLSARTQTPVALPLAPDAPERRDWTGRTL